MRGLIRSLVPDQSPLGTELVVKAVMEALQGIGGSDPLIPTCQANSFGWGWLPSVVTSALQGHPEWPSGMMGISTQTRQELAQLLTRHGHLLTAGYWADMWSWQQVHPDMKTWKEVGLSHYWPEAEAERQHSRAGQDISVCFGLHTLRDGEYDSDDGASPLGPAHSVPGRRVTANEQKRCAIGGGCPFLIEEDFCEDNVNERRGLFLCDSLTQGCVRVRGNPAPS